MAYALCKSCRATRYWRAQRGMRLADLRCKCGGEFRAAQWKGDELVPREAAAVRGRVISCAVCGRKRKENGRNVRRTVRDAVFTVFAPMRQTLEGEHHISEHVRVPVPAGSLICWSHLPDFPSRAKTPEHYRELKQAHGVCVVNLDSSQAGARGAA